MKNKYGFEESDQYSKLVQLAVALYTNIRRLGAGPEVERYEQAYLAAYAALLDIHGIDAEPEIMAWDAHAAYHGGYDVKAFTDAFSNYISREFGLVCKDDAESRSSSIRVSADEIMDDSDSDSELESYVQIRKSLMKNHSGLVDGQRSESMSAIGASVHHTSPLGAEKKSIFNLGMERRLRRADTQTLLDVKDAESTLSHK